MKEGSKQPKQLKRYGVLIATVMNIIAAFTQQSIIPDNQQNIRILYKW